MGATPEWSWVVLTQEQMSPSSDSHVLYQATRTTCRENVPANQLAYQGPSQDMCQPTAPWGGLWGEKVSLPMVNIIPALESWAPWVRRPDAKQHYLDPSFIILSWMAVKFIVAYLHSFSVNTNYNNFLLVYDTCVLSPKDHAVESHLYVRGVDLLMFASVLPKRPYETHVFRSFHQGGDHNP